MTRRPSGGGRQRLFAQQQELAVVDLVRADNAIRLHQLRQKILADRQVFNNINHVSITTIRRILGKHSITMKQLYRVPFERNSDRVKGLRAEYVWRILAMDGAAQPHEFIFIDEAGFDLSKTRRRGRNAMEQACGNIQVTAIHGWFRHARGYFPRCLAGEDIACDVDEVLWPDPNRRRDP
ncbi:insertion element IS630 putative 39 kDa -like protein [Labeo rohita]|uniref:Insertion element IS630 putative 39 kDa-like protein n=1 Tax=Labeo rohita TaxID=84645 RepID=A0A498NCW2_LABRO|nr:insertion element IS630 putative 39 kDa -like protein [Labeo rohita]